MPHGVNRRLPHLLRLTRIFGRRKIEQTHSPSTDGHGGIDRFRSLLRDEEGDRSARRCARQYVRSDACSLHPPYLASFSHPKRQFENPRQMSVRSARPVH